MISAESVLFRAVQHSNTNAERQILRHTSLQMRGALTELFHFALNIFAIKKIIITRRDDYCLHEILSCNKGFQLTQVNVWFLNYMYM